MSISRVRGATVVEIMEKTMLNSISFGVSRMVQAKSVKNLGNMTWLVHEGILGNSARAEWPTYLSS